MDDFYSMTVAQLKEQLKERGLPVSGKKAELIARLREGGAESFVPEEKYEIGCSTCQTTLRVPSDYSGGIACPQCKTKSQVTSKISTDNDSNLSGIVSDIEPSINSDNMDSANYNFVEGPDGQFYAVKKSNFTWADWSIGFFGTLGCGWLMLMMLSIIDGEACCWAVPFPGIGLAITGGTYGKPGITTGALTAIVGIPLIFFVGCFVLLFSMDGGY